MYIGAGWDAYPLTQHSIRTDHDLIVYVDALPSTPHYTQLQAGYPHAASEESVIAALTADGGSQVFAGAPVKSAAGSVWSIPLLDCTTLKYFFNTRDDEMTKHPALTELLPHVTTLWVQGYSPGIQVFEQLPNLTTVFATELCADYLPHTVEDMLELIPEYTFEDGEFLAGWNTEMDDIDSSDYESS